MQIPLMDWSKKLTMYRLMLYYLIFLVLSAIVLSLFHVLSYSPGLVALAAGLFCLSCWTFNHLFAWVVKTKPNPESQLITALILTLIVGPLNPFSEFYLIVLLSGLAMGSKYIFAWRKRHFFNPAAFAVVASALLIHQGASWWISSIALLPFVVLGGLVVLIRIRRLSIVLAFLLTYCLLISLSTLIMGSTISAAIALLYSGLFYSPLIFFSFVMLIEPMTSPTNSRQRLYYGSGVAAAFLVSQLIFPSVPYSLELALLIGNLIVYMFNRDRGFTFTLKEKKEIAPHTLRLLFESDARVNHTAGQYLEWTLPHSKPDSRGIRRFFTISSSPTEPLYMLTTKLSEKSSSFKTALNHMTLGEKLYTGHLQGEFVLPKDADAPCVFIAGGIGITPFRSIVKYMLDANLKRPITLFYSNRTAADIVYKDLFVQAEKEFGLKTVYTITDDVPANWKGRTGFINSTMIEEEVPDFKERLFYISGPEPMVAAFEKMIASMGVANKNIRRDFFPGYTDTHQAKR